MYRRHVTIEVHLFISQIASNRNDYRFKQMQIRLKTNWILVYPYPHLYLFGADEYRNGY